MIDIVLRYYTMTKEAKAKAAKISESFLLYPAQVYFYLTRIIL